MIDQKVAKLEAAQFAHDKLLLAEREFQALLLAEYRERGDRELIAAEFKNLVNTLYSKVCRLEKELAVKGEAG